MQLKEPPTPVLAPPVAPVASPRRPQVFHRAVEVLKAKHQVSDAVAYTMLVQFSVDARTSVREAARNIIRASLATR